MANDGIRLPGDTTVASQKVHRGSHAQDTQVMPATPKESAQPKILMTVVLQSKPLIEGAKGGLFELMLQNDPRTAPPINLRSDTFLSPGTSLLLELDEQGVYRPVDRPSRAQLTQLIQLELDFWRAHLLPKAGRRAFPTTPEPALLSRLGSQFPELKPLTDWLTQRPADINGREVQRWIQELTPLSLLRNWPATAQTQPGVRPTFSGPVVILPAQHPIPAPHPGLTEAIGRQSSIAPASSLQQSPSIQAQLPLQDLPAFKFNGQRFTLSSEVAAKGVSAAVLHNSLSPVRVRPTLTDAPVIRPAAATTTSSTETIATAAAAMTSRVNAATQAPLQSVLPIPLTVIKSPGAAESFRLTLNAEVRSDQIPRTQSPIGTALSTPLPEPVPMRRPNELPLEMKLGLWLMQLDKAAAQQPSVIQNQLQGKAEEALRHLNTGPIPPIVNTPDTQSSGSTKEEPPLLTLRNWLDATLARMQNNAVQSAAAQISQPDQPVQQMQLPLIWLGLTSWADVEWWQPAPKKDRRQKERKDSEQRRWRMRMYLTLTPLGKVCADLDWGTDQTQLTLWSEDPATLNHLHQLLPTLNEWTEGLGERQLNTKHGMPQRQNEHHDDEPSHHLVDIKT